MTTMEDGGGGGRESKCVWGGKSIVVVALSCAHPSLSDTGKACPMWIDLGKSKNTSFLTMPHYRQYFP
jgi:hypothetical protein